MLVFDSLRIKKLCRPLTGRQLSVFVTALILLPIFFLAPHQRLQKLVHLNPSEVHSQQIVHNYVQQLEDIGVLKESQNMIQLHSLQMSPVQQWSHGIRYRDMIFVLLNIICCKVCYIFDRNLLSLKSILIGLWVWKGTQ